MSNAKPLITSRGQDNETYTKMKEELELFKNLGIFLENTSDIKELLDIKIEGLQKMFDNSINYQTGKYSILKKKYNFNNILNESSLSLNNDDTVFICSQKMKIISFCTIDSKLEIGNSYTLNSERKKGYSKQIAKNIANYVKDNKLLCYIFTTHEYVKKTWEDTQEFYTVLNNNDNKFTGTFNGLNNETYDLSQNYYVLRNNNCTSLFIFHNTSQHSMADNRIEAESILKDFPKYNKLVINFEGDKTYIKGLYKIDKTLNKKSYDNNFYEYIKKDYTEIKYRNIFIFSHGGLLPNNGDVKNKKFNFGDYSILQNTTQFITALGDYNNYFILLGTCYSNYFIDELNGVSETKGNLKKPSNILALSAPTVGDKSCQIPSTIHSIQFINDYKKGKNVYKLKTILENLKNRQLLNTNGETEICPLGHFIKEIIRGDMMNKKIHNVEVKLSENYDILIQNICILYNKNTEKYIPLEEKYIILINDALVKTNEVQTFKPYGDYDINYIKEQLKSFLESNNRRGINNSKVYIGSNFERDLNKNVDIFCK